MKKQLEFFDKPRLEHGGVLNRRRRKKIRPLTTKYPVHIVLRSDKAKGKLNLLRHQKEIETLLQKWAKRFRISIYQKSIVGNHIHLLVRGKRRVDIQNFFRTIAALIARKVTGSRKGKPFGKFWSYLIYSRCLQSWKREFINVSNYIIQNTFEALGRIPYRPRKKYALF